MLNSIIVMGRLTADPAMGVTNNGVSYCRFSVACDRNFKNGQQTETDFFSCVAWRKTSEFISRFFHKGEMIAIRGMMQQRRYKDKNGEDRVTYEIVVDDASFCGSRKKGEDAPPAEDYDEVAENF